MCMYILKLFLLLLIFNYNIILNVSKKMLIACYIIIQILMFLLKLNHTHVLLSHKHTYKQCTLHTLHAHYQKHSEHIQFTKIPTYSHTTNYPNYIHTNLYHTDYKYTTLLTPSLPELTSSESATQTLQPHYPNCYPKSSTLLFNG